MRVSVIVANYNYGYYISRTLTSLISQSMPASEFEIIVVDDCSNDISMKLLEPYLDSIRLLRADKHEGVIAICNEGFRRARGEFVVRVDADDYVHKSLLEIETLFLTENKDFEAVCCDYYKVDDKGNKIGRFDASKEPIACGVMFRRDALIGKGLYQQTCNVWEDRDFVKQFQTYRIPLPLYRYLQHDDSLTHKEGNVAHST